ATIVAPGMADAPKLDHVSGMKLEQVLLITTGTLIVLVVALLAGAFAFTTSQLFAQTGAVYEHRLQDQAKELGQTVSKTLSLTTRNNIRDNDYGTVNDVVHSLVKDNPNVLRVQVFDGEGAIVGRGVGRVAPVVTCCQSGRPTRRLGTLNATGNQLASGNLEARAPTISGAREVKTLGIVFNHVADRTGYLLEDARTKPQLER